MSKVVWSQLLKKRLEICKVLPSYFSFAEEKNNFIIAHFKIIHVQFFIKIFICNFINKFNF